MEEEKEGKVIKSGYSRGVVVGLLVGIALFMLTYKLLLMAR
jgi:hypothetical protein